MTANELRKKFLDFMEEKGHKIIPSASLIPENDPTVLFTTAGMHPLVPYLMGEKHPAGKLIADAQKCIRTVDIDEVGDAIHHTFFEMLGNWSLGDYFKKNAIRWSWEFLTSKDWLNLDKNRIAVSVFAGDADAPFDEEAYGIWKKIFSENNLPVARIAKLPKKNNWWGPAGVTGPCGPDTEMFYWAGDENKAPESFNDDNDQWVEIWNDVFMEFNKTSKGKFEPLKQKNVDTGMGLERTLAVISGLDDNYQTELFWPIIEKIEKISGKKYEDNKKEFRIIADHIKASVFIIADGIVPSNVQRGYVVRRLIRRAIRQGHSLGIKNNFTVEIAKVIQNIYRKIYPEIFKENILNILEEEENKFRKTLENPKGREALKKIFNRAIGGVDPDNFPGSINNKMRIDGSELVRIYETYGLPIEISQEIMTDWGMSFDEQTMKEAEEEFKKHQELSRTASVGMFKGGLADTKEKTTQLHTVAHLMVAGLRKVLGGHVHQRGANINGERVRFDFSHPEKMTDEQKKAVEDYVNVAIEKKVPVELQEMSPEEAKVLGAEGEFSHKYGNIIKVYTIKDYSKEICGGPHVKNTGDIHGKFKIIKEESGGAGIRRIKAVIA